MNQTRRAEKRVQAEKRSMERTKRGLVEQVRVLDIRLGNGVGAVKERFRLRRKAIELQIELDM